MTQEENTPKKDIDLEGLRDRLAHDREQLAWRDSHEKHHKEVEAEQTKHGGDIKRLQERVEDLSSKLKEAQGRNKRQRCEQKEFRRRFDDHLERRCHESGCFCCNVNSTNQNLLNVVTNAAANNANRDHFTSRLLFWTTGFIGLMLAGLLACGIYALADHSFAPAAAPTSAQVVSKTSSVSAQVPRVWGTDVRQLILTEKHYCYLYDRSPKQAQAFYSDSLWPTWTLEYNDSSAVLNQVNGAVLGNGCS